MARRGDDGSEVSVLRTEAVPLQQVSSVGLRRAAGGDMTAVEGWLITRNGRATGPLDAKQAKENLVLLEPPVAEVAKP